MNDDLAWTKGRHTVKAGVDFRYDKYTYTSIASGPSSALTRLNDVADFANGKLNFSGTGLGSSFAPDFPGLRRAAFPRSLGRFLRSDEWAVSKNLKLTYGMRFEKDLNPSCIENCFVLTNVPFISPSYQGGVNVPVQHHHQDKPTSSITRRAVIPQPRLGIAWKPFGNGKTVIRGGVGLFSTNYTDGLAGTFANQIPNNFTPSGLTTGNIGLVTDPTTPAYTAQASANAFFNGFKPAALWRRSRPR